MREIRTYVDIAAPAAQVWAVLADLPGYAQWNPYIRLADGELAPGARLEITFAPAGSRARRARPQVITFTPGEEMRWRRRLPLPGVFDTEHVFRLENGPDGTTRFVHRERYSGMLVWLFWSDVRDRAGRAVDLMNRALKLRVERGAVPGVPAG